MLLNSGILTSLWLYKDAVCQILEYLDNASSWEENFWKFTKFYPFLPLIRPQ